MATELDQRMAEETANIKVDSYQKVASLGGWSGGGRTLWAIGAVAAIAGAGIGLVAPFFPLIVGASTLATAVAAIPASVAAFAAIGLSMGFGGGLMLGRVSGAAAAVAEENERRMKEWTTRQMLQQNPDAHIIPDAPPEPTPKKPFWQRVKDNYHTYFNPRVGLTMTAIGAIGGLVMGAAFIATGGAAGAIMPVMGILTGLGEAGMTAPVILAYSAGVAGGIGALFCFNFPKITSHITHFFGELLSGRPLGREWGPQEKHKAPALAASVSHEEIAARDVNAEGKFTKNASRAGSFQELIANQAAAQSGDMLIKR